MAKTQILISIKFLLLTMATIGAVAWSTPVQAAPLKCVFLPQGICDSAESGTLESSGIWGLLKATIQILTVGIGIVAVAALTYAGFLYTTAQESSEQTKKAKAMILNTVVGLIAYALMWALLQYLIPGGVF